jgi:hypothetical protein
VPLALDLANDNAGAAVRHCLMNEPLDEPTIRKAVRFKRCRVVFDANNPAIGCLGDRLARTLLRIRV